MKKFSKIAKDEGKLTGPYEGNHVEDVQEVETECR
jgi:hypothetical protein